MSTFRRCQQQIKCILQDEFQVFAVFPAITGLSTILLCYIVAVDYKGHIPAYFSLPEVSLLGAKEPEHTLYQIGVCITFIAVMLFYFSFGYFLDNIIGAQTYYISKSFMKFSIVTLGVGLLFQGLICLSIGRLKHLNDDNVLNWHHWDHDRQSVIHRIFAAIFFLSAIIHEMAAVQFYFRFLSQHMYSKWFKLWLLIIAIVSVIGILLFHQIDNQHNNPQIQSLSLHYAGIFEWIMVFSMFIFFASYAVDYYWINVTQTGDYHPQERPILNENHGQHQLQANTLIDRREQQMYGRPVIATNI